MKRGGRKKILGKGRAHGGDPGLASARSLWGGKQGKGGVNKCLEPGGGETPAILEMDYEKRGDVFPREKGGGHNKKEV